MGATVDDKNHVFIIFKIKLIYYKDGEKVFL